MLNKSVVNTKIHSNYKWRNLTVNEILKSKKLQKTSQNKTKPVFLRFKKCLS